MFRICFCAIVFVVFFRATELAQASTEFIGDYDRTPSILGTIPYAVRAGFGAFVLAGGVYYYASAFRVSGGQTGVGLFYCLLGMGGILAGLAFLLGGVGG